MTARLRHHLPALALACLLAGVWTMRDWAALSALQLPDTDDMMRLQQGRDWLAGAAFGPVQERLADGVPMHWSRIGDLAPAAVILALRGIIGTHGAEVAAVILWPTLQFAALLALISSITARLAPAARGTAIVLAALAYPAAALFAPGRIDHHALQLLLVLVQVWALLGAKDWRSGAGAGIAVAAGAAIGLETIPFAMLTGGLIAWTGGARQQGFGLALAAGLTLLLPIAGTGGVCDTIAPLAPAAVLGGLAMAVTASGRYRLPLLGLAGAAIGSAFREPIAPCLAGPYAAVDPMVARLWLDHVQEARPLLAVPPLEILAYAGPMLVGLAAGAVLAMRRRGGWTVVLAFQLTSLAIAFLQLRGVYVGAALAAVPLAVLLAEARARQRIARVAALWIGGAGLLYPVAAAALSRSHPAGDGCTRAETIAALRTLPPGRVLAPIDTGADIIAATPHTALAGPYHRNNAGNAAMYRFFLGDERQARRVAASRRVDHVLLCRGAFAETGAVTPHNIAGGARPAWLVARPSDTPNLQLFAIQRRLLTLPAGE